MGLDGSTAVNVQNGRNAAIDNFLGRSPGTRYENFGLSRLPNSGHKHTCREFMTGFISRERYPALVLILGCPSPIELLHCTFCSVDILALLSQRPHASGHYESVPLAELALHMVDRRVECFKD
jgi:hypothetical protein